MQNLFSGCACRVWSLLVCAHRFFLCCPVNSCCACRNFFFLCPVTSSLLGARSFFWALLLSPRAMHACQGRQFFFPVQSLPAAARTIFFTAPHYCRVRSLLLLCPVAVSPAQQGNNFFVTSVQQCEGYRARRTFLLRSSFSFAVRSHLRRHLVLFFF
jgi:hypothetical protein